MRLTIKRIINGRAYDTATATEIGGNGYSTPNDFRHYYERLYRKRNGEYFLYGEGGPLSKYSESVGTATIKTRVKFITASYDLLVLTLKL